MAHMIELIDDKIPMFYVGEQPWHGLGYHFDSAPSLQEALVASGLDFHVDKLPLFTQDGRLVNHVATCNANTGDILGVVGENFSVLQNKDAFKFLEPFIDSGLVKLEVAGALRKGKTIFILARITGVAGVVGNDDIILPYFLISNSHDGTRAFNLGFTDVRVVCNNTLQASDMSDSKVNIKIYHKGDIKQTLFDMQDTINMAKRQFEGSLEKYEKLAKANISKDKLEKYFRTVLEYPLEGKLEGRQENKIIQLTELFEAGKGNKGMTVFDAYNAFTEYASHHSNKNIDSRYNSLLFGASKNKIDLALTEALKIAA